MSTDQQENIIRGHAEDADGILEYDNQLPRWWVALFWITIIWAVVLILQWHVLGNRTLAQVYNEEIAAAGPPTPPIDTSTIAIVYDAAAIEKGQAIYMTNCVACHQADASGGIGANLKDATWIHGNTKENIRDVVAKGVLEKGMPSWYPVIGAEGVANVTAYIYSLSNPPPM